MYRTVREELARRGVSSDVLILADPTDEYFKKLQVARSVEPVFGFEQGRMTTGILRVFGTLPLIDILLKAIITRFIVRQHLRHTGASTLATSDDRALAYPLATLSAARSLLLPIALLPIESFIATHAQTVDKAKVIPAMTGPRSIMRTIIKRLYPQGIRYTSDEKEVHFYQPRYLVPLLVMWPSLLPRNPWVRGSHTALASVFVNSQRQVDENVAGGEDLARMSVTGFPAHDAFIRLYSSRKDEKKLFEKEFKVSAQKIFLLIGTHFRATYAPSEFPLIHREMHELFALIRDNVPADYTIVIKLHPSVKLEEWGDFINELGERPRIIIHSEWDAYRLAATADMIFMFTSALVITALATDVPVVAYKIRLASFDELYQPYKSIRLARTIEELSGQLAMPISLSDKESALRRDDRKRFGVFDGKCSERIADALVDL